MALFAAELARPENTPLTDTMNALKAMAVKYQVGVADMLMFAGCMLAKCRQKMVTNKAVSARGDQLPWRPNHQNGKIDLC